MSGTKEKWKGSPPGLQPRMDDTQVHPGAKWVLQPVRDGEWWYVVDREKCSAVGEGYPQETRPQAPERLCQGGKAGGSIDGNRKELKP